MTHRRDELLNVCGRLGIKNYKSKNKNDLVKMIDDTKLKMVDLFSGTGAFTLAFEKTGLVKCVFANDMSPSSKTIYDENFNHKLTLGDLNDVKVEDIPAHDILTGGFPCFIKGTRTLTSDGYRNIEDVELNDKLLTHTGTFQNILNLQQKLYTGIIYHIQFKHNQISCTPYHPFYIRTQHKNWNKDTNKYDYYYDMPIWKDACKLNDNDYFGMIMNYNDEMNIDFIDGIYGWTRASKITTSINKNIMVYNFEVENDNSYVVENVIVHNCQPFSIAGKQQGFQDSRANVFWKILEIIDYHKPKYVILENVKNLTSHDDENTFKTIKTKLNEKGYFIQFKVLNTSDITDIPQHRERIYIVCIKSEDIHKKFSLDFDKKEKKGIKLLLEKGIANKYYYTDSSKIWNMLKDSVVKDDTVYQYRRVYVRENKNNECPTLTANMGTGGHNVPLVLDAKGIRKLIPRECFNFQGFPQTYTLPKISDAQLYKLAGNAVSFPVVELIANRLINIIFTPQ